MSAGSEDIALAVQARLPDLNRTVLIDTIEGVLDSYSSPARHIRIDRLRLNLGTIVFGRGFEEDVKTRLEQELRRALDEAVFELENQPTNERFAQSAEEARLDLLEHYLKNGTLPFWAAAAAFDIEAVVTETATATPDALVRLLRRHRHASQVTRRLVAQLSDQALGRLLELIDPVDTGQVSGEIETARREDRRFATWVRILTDAVFEHRDAAGRVARDGRQLEGDSDGRGDGGPSARPDGERQFEQRDPSMERPDASPERPDLLHDEQAAPFREEQPDLSRYDRTEGLRYYLRHGVLPWTLALAQGAAGGVPLSVEALLDTLPGLPLSVLRSVFPVRGGDRPAALLRAVGHMSADTRARLLAALWAETRSDEPFSDAPTTARVIEHPRVYVRTVLRMLHGGAEVADEAGESPAAPAPGDLPAPLSDVQWIKSILVERANRGERRGPTDVSSTALLQLLVQKHPADAEHFFRVLRGAGLSPAALLVEPVSPRLFASVQTLLTTRARTTVGVLLRLVSRLPAHDQPGDENGVRTAVMGAVLEYIAAGRTEGSEPPVSLAAGVLRALFGTAMAADTLRQLATGAAQLAHDGETAEGQETVSRALVALGYAASATVHPTGVETDLQDAVARVIADLPATAARRVTAVVRIVSAWPPGERSTGDDGIRKIVVRLLDEQTGEDALAPGFLARVLRAVLGTRVTAPIVGRLLEDTGRLAARGDLTRADVEAVSQAAGSLTDARAPEPSEAERIVSVLTRRIDGASQSESGVPSSASLLRTLVERFPHDARAFLQKARDAGVQPSMLLTGATAPELLEPVAGLLRPLDRRLVALILRVVSVLTAAERLGSDAATRTVLAGAVLDHACSTSTGEELATAAMRRLLGPTSPYAVRRLLATEVERAGRTGQVGPDAVTVLLRVLGTPEDPRDDTEDLRDPARDGAVSGDGVPVDEIKASEPTIGVAPFRTGDARERDLAETNDSVSSRDRGPADRDSLNTHAIGVTGRGSAEPSGDAPAGPPAPRPAEHPPTLAADSVAAALARLRDARQITGEVRASGEEPAAPVSRQPATPPRLYQPSRFPRRGPLAGTARSGETGAPSPVPPPAAVRERASETAGARAQLSDDALRHILLELVETSPATVRELLLAGLAERNTRAGWVQSFTEPELARIVWLLEPARHRVLIAAAELLFAALDNAASRQLDASAQRRALWAFVLEVLSRHPEGERSLENLVPEFFAYIGDTLADRGALQDRGETAERVFAKAVRLTERRGHAHLRGVLSQRRAELMALATGQGRLPSAESGERSRAAIATKTPPSGWMPSPTSSRQRMAFSMDEERLEADGEPIHISNAGLVMVGVFLPQFFSLLDVLEEKPTGGNRVRPEAVSRVVHLLQFLVDQRTDTPEPLLSLNKVLCGVPLAVPVDREIEITDRERELCDSLLTGLLQQWTIIKDSSVAALRETYLQREGRLDHLPTGWRLRVQRKTVDQLMEYMPWPVSTIAHSWMQEPLYVTW